MKFNTRPGYKKSHLHAGRFSFVKESSGTYFTTVKKKNFSLLCCDFMKSEVVLRELQNRCNKNYTSLSQPAVRSLRYIRRSRLFINESEAFVTESYHFLVESPDTGAACFGNEVT